MRVVLHTSESDNYLHVCEIQGVHGYSVILSLFLSLSFSIPAEQQRLRWGFPPRELRPSVDPTHPVELANGERVSVDVVASAVVKGGGREEGEGEREGGENKEVDSVKQKVEDLDSARLGEEKFLHDNTSDT